MISGGDANRVETANLVDLVDMVDLVDLVDHPSPRLRMAS